MSEWGAIVDVVESHCRVAMPDMPAGTRGFEYSPGFPELLSDNHFPHVFTVYPLETISDRPDFLQRSVDLAIEFVLCVKGESLEKLSLRLDALVTRVTTDPTLGGLVDDCWISARDARGVFTVGEDHVRQVTQTQVASFVVQTERAA